jgi:GTP cyclohydrolase II
MPEVREAMVAGRLHADGRILLASGSAVVTKAAIEPVWWLPGVAARFRCSEAELRRALFEETGGMYPELVTRSDLEVFLPPIGGQTVYVFGNPKDLARPDVTLTARVHDECNGSDVFGSDICTCRPYLTHAIEESIRGAQDGGVGVVVYCRKEGRALGEVTKFLVYNARKRAEGGDSASNYFLRTECVAGVQDMRFQELMPDVLHWLGVRRIHRLVSMSNLKYDAIVGAGIEVGARVQIPEALIPADARVEMDAKKAAGYFTESCPPDPATLAAIKGRGL